MYAGQCYGTYTNSLVHLVSNLNRLGVTTDLHFIYNESLVQRARNAVAAAFMKSDASYLLFIDSDIGFNPNQTIELVLTSIMRDLPLIGASYPMKALHWPGIRNAINKGVTDPSLMHYAGFHVARIGDKGVTSPYYQPFEVAYLGTGFMLIHRKVFTAIEQKFPNAWYKNNHVKGIEPGERIWSYFDCEKDEIGTYLSEDYLFCKRSAESGFPPYMCGWIYLQHTGTFVYEGCFSCSNGSYVHDIRK